MPLKLPEEDISVESLVVDRTLYLDRSALRSFWHECKRNTQRGVYETLGFSQGKFFDEDGNLLEKPYIDRIDPVATSIPIEEARRQTIFDSRLRERVQQGLGILLESVPPERLRELSTGPYNGLVHNHPVHADTENWTHLHEVEFSDTDKSSALLLPYKISRASSMDKSYCSSLLFSCFADAELADLLMGHYSITNRLKPEEPRNSRKRLEVFAGLMRETPQFRLSGNARKDISKAITIGNVKLAISIMVGTFGAPFGGTAALNPDQKKEILRWINPDVCWRYAERSLIDDNRMAIETENGPDVVTRVPRDRKFRVIESYSTKTKSIKAIIGTYDKRRREAKLLHFPKVSLFGKVKHYPDLEEMEQTLSRLWTEKGFEIESDWFTITREIYG